MKRKKQFLLVLLMILTTMILSGCAGNSAMSNAVSWPGLSADDETVYVAYTSSVQAVSNGKLLWKYPAEAQNGMMFFAAPTIYDGKIYTGTYQNEVHILDQNDGTLITKITLETNKNKILASPVIADDMLFIASNNGSVYAYTLDNLSVPAWQTNLSTEIWVSPFVSDGKVYVTTLDKRFLVLDEKTGTIEKALSISGAVMGKLIFANDRIYFGTLGKEVAYFDPATEEIKTVMHTNGEIWASPLIIDGKIIVADMSGYLYCNESESGKSIWQIKAVSTDKVGFIADPILLQNGNLLAVAEDGNLMVYDTDGKSVNSRLINGKTMSSPVVIGESFVAGLIPGDALLRSYTSDLKEDWWYIETVESTALTPTAEVSQETVTETPAK